MNIFSVAIDFLLKGGWIMYPLLVLAGTSVFVMIERFIAIRKASADNEEFVGHVRKELEAGRTEEALKLCDATPGPVPQLIASGIRNRHLDNASIERAMEELALRQTPLLHKRLGVLDTVITMAPLMGLLGTITGMISSFNVVAGPDAASKTGALTGGVAEALIATATGLTIAIVTLPIYNFLTERVKEIISDMEVRATQLLNILATLREREKAEVVHEVAPN
ncbi:MotA/TolQ/ExbB proton channel family protein [bacterium]|nr:MAG: MotA/TolQ/ExbB proton channel family protein [bacterium]